MRRLFSITYCVVIICCIFQSLSLGESHFCGSANFICACLQDKWSSRYRSGDCATRNLKHATKYPVVLASVEPTISLFVRWFPSNRMDFELDIRHLIAWRDLVYPFRRRNNTRSWCNGQTNILDVINYPSGVWKSILARYIKSYLFKVKWKACFGLFTSDWCKTSQA